MAVTSERFERLEDRVNSEAEKAAELRGSYEHLATKQDVTKAVLWTVGVMVPAWIGIAVQIVLLLSNSNP